MLSPQHSTAWVVSSAQVWFVPAASLLTPDRPTTVTGVELLRKVPPPSWPDVSSPQHSTVASATTTQVW